MRLLIAGDFVPRYRVAELVAQKKYEDVFSEVRPIIGCMDYSIINFESPVIQGKETPIGKTGPNLFCREEAMEAVKYMGFDCVTLANNHFRDQGDQGVRDTLAACAKYGVDHVGGGQNLQVASSVLYKRFPDCTLAIINFCENEWSIASSEHGGSAPLHFVKNYYAIQEAKKNADYVIVIVHAGIEEYNLPAPWMKESHRYFIDCGADVVVNHHQHCYSGYERYHHGLIFYGLGNFCFDYPYYRGNQWNKGYMVALEIAENIDFQCIPYIQCDEEAKVVINTDRNEFESHIMELNQIIANDEQLQSVYLAMVKSKSKMLDRFEPYMGHKFLTSLWRKHLLPTMLDAKRSKMFLNTYRCESYRDILISLLNTKTCE